MRVILVLLLSVPALAQGTNPLSSAPGRGPKSLSVITAASATTVRAGGMVSLFVDVAPNPGIHVYAPGAKGYQAIVVKLDAAPGVIVGRATYPKSDLLFFAPLRERVPVFQAPFRLAQDVTLARTLKTGSVVIISGAINYQACDDAVCYQPASAPVSWTLTVN